MAAELATVHGASTGTAFSRSAFRYWLCKVFPRASPLTSWVVNPQALLWRNWKLKKRSWASTVVELLSPIVLVGLLVSK